VVYQGVDLVAEELAMRRRRLTVIVPLLAVLAATVVAGAPPAGAGGGCHGPATERRGGTLTLSEQCFNPTVLRVAPGSEVTIVNRDEIVHPLARPGGEWGWDGGVGASTTVRLDGSGIYPFFCYVHPGMVGVVVVGDGAGGGSKVVSVASGTPAPAAPAAAVDPDEPAANRFPTAWMVLIALCALVGAAAGTRLTGRGSGTT
jgi:plastocyanin